MDVHLGKEKSMYKKKGKTLDGISRICRKPGGLDSRNSEAHEVGE